MRTTVAIIVSCVAVFITQAVVPGFTEFFSLIPAFAMGGYYWQFFTYMFLHGSLFHITINMLILFMFGVLIERAMGWKWYLAVFIISGLGSAILHMVLSTQSLIPMLGASGAVFGVLTAYAFMFPETRLYVFPLPVPIKVIHAVIGIAVFELLLGLFDILPGFAHFGHLGGIVTGFAIMMYWKRARKRGLKTEKDVRNFEFYWE